MNRAVSGTVVVMETGRPLAGLIVVAGRLCPAGVERLGWALSADGGRFRIEYPPLEEPSDMVLLLYRPSGELLFTEPPHRLIAGAELRLQVEIPQAALLTGLH